MCWSHSERKWIEVKTIDLSRKEVLSRNILATISQDLGVQPNRAIGIGRIAEAYRTGESIVGKLALYEIDLDKPLCKLCPAHALEIVELRSSWIRGPETGLIYDLGLGESLVKKIRGSLMILGESLNTIAVALVAERSGVNIYSLKRRIPGVRTHIVSLDSWDELKVRDFYIGGRLSDEERSFLEERLIHANRIRIFYHPLLRGSKFLLSLAENIVLRRVSKPIITKRTILLTHKLYKLATDRYIISVKPGSDIPENIYAIIDFGSKRDREAKKQGEIERPK